MRKSWEINRQIGNPLPWLKHVAGRYYTSPLITQLSTTSATTDNFIWAHPFFVPYTTTYDRIGVDLISGANAGDSTGALGIYNHDDAAGAPTTLVLDAGTFLLTANGDKEITISQSLARGWYWLAMAHGATIGTPLFRGATGTSNMSWLGTVVTLVPATNSGNYLGWTVAFTYAGTLPNPFTVGGALNGVGSLVANPNIYLRAA